MKRVTSALIMFSILMAACTAPTATPSTTPAPTATIAPTVTATALPTPTATPTREESLQPGRLVEHPATDDNPYVFYSYFPRSAARNQEVVVGVWPCGGKPRHTEDYAVPKTLAAGMIVYLAEYSEAYQIPIVVVAMPVPERLHVGELHRHTFTTDEEMLRRPDLKLIDAVWDQYIPSLRNTGLRVDERVLMMGYSSPGAFAHRFSMLHPKRVKAVWLGGEAPAPLPIAELDGRPLNYPLGVADLQTLTGEPFDLETYRTIPHFVCVGENDVKPENDPTIDTDVFSKAHRQFIHSHFGSTKPEQIRFFYEQLVAVGVPAEFRLYEGMEHTITDPVLPEAFDFLTRNSGIPAPPTPTPTPRPTLPFVIDGQDDDWAGMAPVLEDPQGDSLALRGSDTDLRAVYLAQDDNFVFVMIRTYEPLSKEALMDLDLDLRPYNPCGHNFELSLNIFPTSNRLRAYEENPCKKMFPFPMIGDVVSWGDVLEVRIPRSSLGEHTYVRINYVTLHAKLNSSDDQSWAVVDEIKP